MSNEKSWLVKRLTPRQKKEPRWVQLAEAIEEFWDQNFEPAISDYENLRSAFTASKDGIDLKLAEAGIKFEAILPISPTGKAVAYAQRGYEIHRKDRKASLEQILQREFRGSVFRWLPLYALPEEEYGERFFTEIEIKEMGLLEDEIYLTSRGKALINVPSAHQSGLTKQEVVDAVARNFDEVRPAHIVYDGVLFISIFYIEVKPVIVWQALSIIKQWHQMDVEDFKEVSHKHTSKRAYTIDFSQWLSGTPWRLDMGWWINGEFRPLQGLEGDIIDTLAYLGSDHISRQKIEFDPTVNLHYDWAESTSAINVNPDPLDKITTAFIKTRVIQGDQNKDYFEKPWRLDMGWWINGVYRRIAGIEGDTVDVLTILASDSIWSTEISIAPTLAGRDSVKSISTNTVDANPVAKVLKFPSKTRFNQVLFGSLEKPPMPSFDDIPSDFAPLDTYYEWD